MDLATKKALLNLENALIEAPRVRPFQDCWPERIPLDPGVYVFWDRETGTPKYVGETSSLLFRMRDVGRRVNHTFPRKISNQLGLNAISDEDLSRVISQRFELSFIPVHFGRAELEEYLVLKWRLFLINTPAQRLLRSPWYRDVQRLNGWSGAHPKAEAVHPPRTGEPVRY